MTPMPRTRHRARHRADHRPRSETSTNGSSTTPAVRARAVTAAAGDQPVSSSGLMNAPEVANETAETTAATRPADIDEIFMRSPWAEDCHGLNCLMVLTLGRFE